MLKQALTILFILGTFSLFSQQQKADSIQELLQGKISEKYQIHLLNELGNTYRYFNNDSARKYIDLAEQFAENRRFWDELADAWTEKGILFRNLKKKDSSYYYLGKAYKLSQKHSIINGTVKSLNSIGLYFYFDKKLDTAFWALNTALLYVDNIEDKQLITMLYNNLALINKTTGKDEAALDFYFRALDIADQNKDALGRRILCNNIGLLYLRQKKTNEALKYFQNALELARNEQNLSGESKALTNIGLVYELRKENRTARTFYFKSLEIKERINHQSGIGVLYNNLAITYKNENLYDSAFFYCKKAILQRQKLKQKLGEARSRTILGELYLKQKNIELAKEELLNALDLALPMNNIEVLSNIYSNLHNLTMAQGAYKEAVSYLNLFHAMQDSLFNLEKEKGINNVEMRYLFLKKEKETMALQNQLLLKEVRIKKQWWIAFSLAGLAIAVLIILVLVNRSKNRLNSLLKDLEEKNHEISSQADSLNELLLKQKQLTDFNEAMTNMIAHDLKTPLTSIINVKLIKDKELQENMVQQSGYRMLNLVQNMLDVYKHQEGGFQLSKQQVWPRGLVNQASEELQFLAQQKAVQIENHITAGLKVAADPEIFKRIIVNLLSNAVKFSPKGEAVKINACITDRNFVRISVSNQGKGIPREKQDEIFERFGQSEKVSELNIRSTGLGLTFCKLAIEAHKGEIGVVSETEFGVEFWFTLPDAFMNSELVSTQSEVESDQHLVPAEVESYLTPFIGRKVYEGSLLLGLLKEIPTDTPAAKQWVDGLRNAIFSGDQDTYDKLTTS